MRLEIKKGIDNCYLIDDTYNNDFQGLTVALDFLKQQKQRQNKTVILTDIQQSGLTDAHLYKKVNELLGLPECENWETDLHWDYRLEGQSLGEKTILFPRD